VYILAFYVPTDQADLVKEALFAAGAGRMGAYDSCAWQTEGLGQFRPLSGSNPFIGEKNKLEYVDELKVEIVCHDQFIREVVKALIEAHPYETPAYSVVKCEDL
jgi:structural hemagglutinin/hemolysin toxin protein RtxA